MARTKQTTKQTARKSTGGKVPRNQPRQWVNRHLYHLCDRYLEEEDSEARILDWFNLHKNDTAYFKATALYTDYNGCTGLHRILESLHRILEEK